MANALISVCYAARQYGSGIQYQQGSTNKRNCIPLLGVRIQVQQRDAIARLVPAYPQVSTGHCIGGRSSIAYLSTGHPIASA
eukprot:1827170-Rhodomonas_salina.3